nr:hypothetical protein [Saccharomyces paradoxus]
MYNTSTWKYNLMGFINTNNIKMLPIINNLIFIRNMHMNNKSLIKTNNKLYNNTLLNKIRDTTFMSMKHFKNWLSGFVVGDGYFGIKKNMTHSFNITLKKTDIITLENIKYYLNLTSKIYVDNKYNKVQLHTEKLSIIIEKIIPLFKEYPLLSNKYYSFEQWSKSAEMIYYNKDKSLANKFIMNKNLNKGLVLSNSKIPFNKMNKSFILGFIEAEGTFNICMKNNSWQTTMKLNQLTTNNEVLKHIAKNIKTWTFMDNMEVPKSIKESLKDIEYSIVKLDSIKPYTNLNNITNTYSLLKYNKIDLLYYIICPNLNNMKWFSTKYINFMAFMMALEIIIKGLYHTNEGHNFMLKLDELSNSNLTDINDLPWDMYYEMLKMDPIYDLNMPHRMNCQNYAMSIRYNKPVKTGVFIFDLNNNYIMTVGGQAKTAKYFNVKTSEVIKHIRNNTIFLNKYYLKPTK